MWSAGATGEGTESCHYTPPHPDSAAHCLWLSCSSHWEPDTCCRGPQHHSIRRIPPGAPASCRASVSISCRQGRAGRKDFAVTWNGSCMIANARAHPCHITTEPEVTAEHSEGCSAIPSVSCGGPAVTTSRKLERAAARETDETICPYAHCARAGWCGTVLSSRNRFKQRPSRCRRILVWPKVAPASWAHAGITVPSTTHLRDRCNAPPSIQPLAHANDCQHGTEAMKGKKITP